MNLGLLLNDLECHILMLTQRNGSEVELSTRCMVIRLSGLCQFVSVLPKLRYHGMDTLCGAFIFNC